MTNSRTLDFGCGSGELVEEMVMRGYDSYGFELGQSYGAFAKSRLGSRIAVASWQDASYAQEFDLVTAFQVVEHLRDPLNAVRGMVSWLVPRGLICLEVPNLAAQPCKGFGWFHFAHVLGFNTWNLRLLGALAGLRPVAELGPTGIVFAKGESEDPSWLAENGLRLSTETFIKRNPYRTYFEYQLHKLRNQW